MPLSAAADDHDYEGFRMSRACFFTTAFGDSVLASESKDTAVFLGEMVEHPQPRCTTTTSNDPISYPDPLIRIKEVLGELIG